MQVDWCGAVRQHFGFCLNLPTQGKITLYDQPILPTPWFYGKTTHLNVVVHCSTSANNTECIVRVILLHIFQHDSQYFQPN